MKVPSWERAWAYRRLPGLLADPWRGTQPVRKIQERKLARLVRHAYWHVPYYRSLFNSARIQPGDIRTLKDLAALPLTSKAQLRDLPEFERCADNVDLARCQSFATSGTTGIPLRSYFTPEDAVIRNLSWIRSYLHCGVSPFFRTAVFVGGSEAKAERAWYELLGLWRRRPLSSGDTPDSWVRTLRRWRPQVLQGYVMTLRLLADHIRENDVRDIRPRVVLHSSAFLDEPSRHNLESVLGCRVLDFYGSDEGGCLAWECPACRGYHVSSDTVILEVLCDGRPARPGESGEVVITNLHSRAMPFIRYRQEDFVVAAPHAPLCGRRFPLLEGIQGRQDDFISLKDGKKLSPHPFYYALDFVPGIKRWRITQERSLRLKVEIVPGPDLDRAALQTAERNLRRAVNGELPVEISVVEAIEVEPGRKFRAVSSRRGGATS
jgi:phenylacetate-CoA ligase